MFRLLIGVVVALLVMTIDVASISTDQDPVTAVRELYASAAYEDALALLNGLPESNRPADEMRAIEQYRALCLLALGRTTEAERSIEAVVGGDPMYRPNAEVSPRLRTAFSDVRRRVLPNVVHEQYARAKAEYDRKEFAAAAADFTKVLDVLNDPDLAAAGQPLADLRTLAAGFRDLAVIAATPPPPPPPPPTPELPPLPKAPRVYSSDDIGVVPPVAIQQNLPAYPGAVPLLRLGLIEVVIDETGIVESAHMRISVNNAYDPIALAAARAWRYRPAMLNGVAVKYRKVIQVTVKPQRQS